MTRSQIIEELYREGTVRVTVDYWMQFADWELRKEMRQEIWNWLWTYDEEKLMDAYENGKMGALVTSFVRHQWKTKKSVFLYKYCRYTRVSDEKFEYMLPAVEQEEGDDDRMWLIKRTIANLPEKDREIWDTYLVTGEYKETAEVLEMNPWQVKYAVERVRKKVTDTLKWNGFDSKSYRNS